MLPVEPIEEPIADSVQQEELEELNRSNEQVFAELQIIRKEASSLRVELENATQQIESAKQEMEALKKVDEKEVKPTSEDKDEALRNKLKALEKENQILQRNLTHSRLLYQQLNTKYIGKIEKAKGLRSSLEEEVTDLRSVNLRLQKRLDFSQTQNSRKKPTKKQRKAQTKHLHNGMDDCLEQNTDEIDD
jgi:chromosome segregation ATPase